MSELSENGKVALLSFLGYLKQQYNLENGNNYKFEFDFKLNADNTALTFDMKLTTR